MVEDTACSGGRLDMVLSVGQTIQDPGGLRSESTGPGSLNCGHTVTSCMVLVSVGF